MLFVIAACQRWCRPADVQGVGYWFAGSTRFMGSGARIGFHGAYNADTGQPIQLLDIFRGNLLPATLASAMRRLCGCFARVR